MFGTIRRHQKWLWVLISALTIISFVAFFSPQRRRQGGWLGSSDQVGSIDGRPIGREEYREVYREAALSHLFNYGEFPRDDARSRESGLLDQEMRRRFVLIQELRDLEVKVTEAAVARWIAQMPFFRDPTDKRFRRDFYEKFIESLAQRGISPSDFERFARHQVGLEHLISLAGAAGRLVTPQEAEAEYRREQEQVEAEAVFVNSSNYLAQVKVDPAALATYYTNHQATYRIPEKLRVSYVKFAASNYLAEAEQILAQRTNLAAEIEALYQERGTNSFKDANNATLPPEAAKQKLREEELHNVALQEANKKAVAFANDLFEMENKPDALSNLAAAKGLVSGVTEPFTQFETPKNLQVPRTFTEVAAKLTAENPVAEQLIQTDDAVYVIALKDRIPSEVPPLDSIRDRVAQDYTRAEALKLAHSAGEELQTALAKAVAEGKTFQAAASDQNASAVVLPPFSREATSLPGVPNRYEASQLVKTAFESPVGKVSDFVKTPTGGLIVYAKERIPVSDEKVKAELPEYLKRLRQSGQYQAFSDWFRKQMTVAQLILPGDQERTASAK